MGTSISHYKLLSDFQNHEAGFSRWALAERAGRKVFIKEFISPKYPVDPSLNPTLRSSRLKECEEYEKKKIRLYRTINEASDGNLVRVLDFFRQGSRYYAVTEWINHVTISPVKITALKMADRLLLCRTAAHSLAALHEKNIVHADIKESNVLLHMTASRKFVTKMIDFDSSFFAGESSVMEDDLGGDLVYLSPEACRFLCGEPVSLTCKMDVFSMGLLFHQYLTGRLPYFDNSVYDYAHEAVLDDFVLRADPRYIPGPLREIIGHMLLKDPQSRISAREVSYYLEKYHEITYPPNAAVQRPVNPVKTKPRPRSSKLKMSKDFF